MQARELLGYSGSSRFYGPAQLDDLPASELTFALRVAGAECPKLGSPSEEIRFEGAYVLQRERGAPTVPVVYVVQTSSEIVAQRIHRFVWNQNQAPFLIVESPSTIRVYPGFSFRRDSDHPLVSAAKEAADALERLAHFRAESIDDGTLWKHWAHAVEPAKRVDESLLRDLKSLDKSLQKQGVDRKASHGLIGKFVYLRYLRDRDILSDKKLAKWGTNADHIFTQQATLKAFHKVNDELQNWLNGSVFSLGDAELANLSQAQLRLVAQVFRGGSPVGTDELQATLFDVYDFAHIPIETLSCVYEQFLHDAKDEGGSSRGKTLGAYYTPLPLADYVLSELDSRRPLMPGMKVCDPACGSGSLLVQCYRRLIEKQRRIAGRELKKKELRDLLTEHIFGIDRDDDACRIAELSLILTLLDYVQPPDLEDTAFRLPNLRGENIFQGDFFADSGPVHDFLAKQGFDWIVGNPPWAEVKGTPSRDHEHYVVHQWMKEHKDTHPTSGNQIAEAFLWKAGEHLSSQGLCGLVVLAMTWFKKEGTAFRQRFFSERRVWCLANFANLAYVLFAGRSERPASVVFFDSEKPEDDHVIVTFAPFVAEQVANRPERAKRRLFTWNIVVCSKDIREIENSAARLGELLTWKLAMWGTSRDRKLLERLDARFKGEKLEALQQLGITEPHQGLELRNVQAASKEPIEYHPELVGKKKLSYPSLRRVDRIFALPSAAVGVIGPDECYVRKRGGIAGLRVSQSPHILIDASRRFAVFLDEFLAIPPMQVGIAGTLGNEDLLRSLSLFLSSDYSTYHQFFASPQWGVDAVRADLSALGSLPLPLSRLTASELTEWGKLQRSLSDLSRRRLDHEHFAGEDEKRYTLLLVELNDRVFELLGLRASDRWLVEDFVQVQLRLDKGKAAHEVLRPPSSDERESYLHGLRKCLDSFLSPDRGFQHRIQVLLNHDSALLSISLVSSTEAIAPFVLKADDSAARNLATIRDRLRSKRSQWVYFDRALKIYDRGHGVFYQFKPLQRLYWTRRQAVLDADDIIAETLAEGGKND